MAPWLGTKKSLLNFTKKTIRVFSLQSSISPRFALPLRCLSRVPPPPNVYIGAGSSKHRVLLPRRKLSRAGGQNAGSRPGDCSGIPGAPLWAYSTSSAAHSHKANRRTSAGELLQLYQGIWCRPKDHPGYLTLPLRLPPLSLCDFRFPRPERVLALWSAVALPSTLL